MKYKLYDYIITHICNVYIREAHLQSCTFQVSVPGHQNEATKTGNTSIDPYHVRWVGGWGAIIVFVP